MAANDNDLLSRFIENEKKSKRVTILSVVGFVSLACVILYLMGELKEEQKRADSAIFRLDFVKDSIATEKTTLQNMLDQCVGKIASTIPTPPPPVTSSTDPAERKKLILRNIAYRRKITVYLQYQASYSDQTVAIMSTLQANNFNVPGKELIRNINFGTGVKYFSDGDKPFADSVAKIVGQTLVPARDVPVMKNNINAPSGQIDVWLGDYQKVMKAALIEKYNQKIAL